jgi:hypothetical protein
MLQPFTVLDCITIDLYLDFHILKTLLEDDPVVVDSLEKRKSNKINQLYTWAFGFEK